nr:pesticin C-terminus-like muramidase [uncultured Desulfobacter sp.]
MSKKVLKPGDGFKRQRPKMRNEVKKLQNLLVKAGYRVDIDGLFGKGTEKAVKIFQNDKGLDADGIISPNTWKVLEGNEQQGPVVTEASELLRGFRGDLPWVHAREGYAGMAYWPGGESGVTLDPGIDLGYAAPELVDKLYAGLLSPAQFKAVRDVLGVKGKKAENLLFSNSELKSIKISKTQSDEIFPHAAKPYWEAISKRFKTLSDKDTPPSIQTVMLSLSYNRGAHNRALEVLKKPLDEKNWKDVAKLIGLMQQDHKLAGIAKRRRMESELIKSQIA